VYATIAPMLSREADQLAALARIDQVLGRTGLDYWVFGGWAVDLHAGSVTRGHDDIDIAVWADDGDRIASLLLADGWQHAPEEGEDGLTGYEREGVKIEVAFLARAEDGEVFTPLREGRGRWPEGAFGEDVAELRGVHARVVSLRSLEADKSEVRDDAKVAAKDRVDLATLSRLPHLEGERLRLRPFAAGDLDALVSIQSRADVARWLYWEPRDEAEVRRELEKKIAGTSLTEGGDSLSFAVVLRATAEVIGDATLFLLSAQHRQGEIGFVFHPDHHGHGYATETGRLLLELAFEQFGMHRVIGRLEPRNAASARVLERLGMRKEAHFVENELVKGEWQSELVYALLEDEWRPRRT
jgi:RimJ/RimL family protein N-acetyltransferase